MIIEARMKTGRCANGAERDHGVLTHAVPLGEDGQRSDWGKALCRTEPGRLSAGWGRPIDGADITCTRCRNRLEKIEDLIMTNPDTRAVQAELLQQRIDESDLSNDEFARQVVLREPRTVYRWLAGDSPIPSIVLEWLKNPTPHPWP